MNFKLWGFSLKNRHDKGNQFRAANPPRWKPTSMAQTGWETTYFFMAAQKQSPPRSRKA